MSELRTITLDSGKEQLLQDFEYKGITVPAGFVTDGASTPRIFWSIIPRYYKTKKAACVHDYLCSVAESSEYRLAADRCFRIMLVDALVPKDRPKKLLKKILYYLKKYSGLIRSWIGYIGVRIGSYLGVGVYYDK